ncbi:MAG: ABCMn2+/Zn2+ transporter, inner rane subunit [Geminicoccaceae bacterium]|nr:ABCMn2+/Zn2+ transporter, inner rane subunit [Geminicoccaceae bacterium]
MLSTVLVFRDALYGALVIALACSVLGVYVVLRRIVFVGATLAQISSAGIAFALWLGGTGLALGPLLHPTVMSLLLTLAAVMFFASGARGRIPPDATIGVAYAVAAALGILLVAKATTGEAHDIFLQGNILGITRGDTLVLITVAVPVLVLHALFYKELLFVSFDRETARTLGYNVRRWDLLLYLTLGVVIASAMQFAGVMLVFNFLVLPAVTGLLLSQTMRGLFFWSVASALLAAVVGFSLSVPFDLPSGPSISAVSGAFVLLAWAGRRVSARR